MARPACVKIDLAALKHNLERVRSMAVGRSVIAMVKANAYGHGIVDVASALSGADALGVASLEEGLILRKSGMTQPIMLAEGLFDAAEMQEAVSHHFTLVVHHMPHVEMLEKIHARQSLNVWLKINTGMHRLGMVPEDIHSVYSRLLKLDIVKKPIGLMTHFAEADDLASEATSQQLALFNRATAPYHAPRSLANSAAILAWPTTHGDWVRPGLMLYGASPFSGKTGLDHQLKPVMTFSSRLIAITPVRKGGKVGYSGTWMAPEEMLVGIVGVGYGDGYPQFAGNGTPVLVNNKICSLVGRVSMDMLAVDLREQPDAKIGDPVVLWGKGLPAEYIAANSQTSVYEILTRMTPRPRVEIV